MSAEKMNPMVWGGREKIKLTSFGSGDVPREVVKRKTQGTTLTIDAGSTGTFVVTNHWSPATFRDGRRADENALWYDLLVYDVDEGETLAAAKERLDKTVYSYIIATTCHHQAEKFTERGESKGICDRFRIVLPISRSVDPTEYRAIWNHLGAEIAQTRDISTKDLSRFYFACVDLYASVEGLPIDADRVLAEIPPAPICLETKRAARKKARNNDWDDVSEQDPDKLSKRCKEFLKNGAERNWNAELFIAASALRDEGFPLSKAVEMLTEPTLLPKFADIYGGKLTDDDMRTIEQAYVYAGESKDDRFGRELAFGVEVLEQTYKLHVGSDRSLRFYSVVDQDKKVLQPVISSPARFETEIAKQTLRESFIAAFDIIPPHELRSAIVDRWLGSTKKLESPPKQFAFDCGKNEEYALVRLPMPLPGSYPAWEEFLDRLSDRDAFMAFVWSVYELKHRGRQYLWLQGQGKDGKSVVLRVLCKSLGRAGAGLNKSQIESPRYLGGILEHARAAFYGDCKDTHFSQREVLRQITGGDITVIESKHVNGYSAPLYCRLFVASNYDPAMSGDFADTSRLILLHVAPPTDRNPVWEEELERELPQFLHACKAVYQRICPLHDEIALNETTVDLVHGVVAEGEEMFAALFDELFIVDAEFRVWGKEVRAAIDSSRWARSMTSCKQGDFKRWLEREHGIKIVRTRDGVRYEGVSLVTQYLLQPKSA